MATKKPATKAPAKKAAAPRKRKPAPAKLNVLAEVHRLAHLPNSPMGAVTEILAHVEANPHKDLAAVNQILYSAHSNGEKMELLKELLRGKI